MAMIVPQFWAEARIRDRFDGRQVTIRRFGWSDISREEAQANAETRAREALDRFRAGQEVVRRELKRAYNGSEGVPIREEIVSREGETVITRNSYGALCLNTPNVLFADIDFEDGPDWRLLLVILAVTICGLVAVAWRVHWGWICVAVVAAFAIAYFAALWLHRLYVSLAGGSEALARRRLDAFLAAHSDWYVRLYRTPAGLRVLVLSQTFDPSDPRVTEFFQALGTDPIYVRMCQRQHCFRARVSPKPWRIGIGHHMKPRPGVWPVDPERLPARQAWIEAYDRAAEGYASCQFIAALGSGRVDPTAADVQRLHDELSRANRALPMG
jgi:hypothetical protein